MQKQYPPPNGHVQDSRFHGQQNPPANTYLNTRPNVNGHVQPSMPPPINYAQFRTPSLSHSPSSVQLATHTNPYQPQSRPHQHLEANRTQSVPLNPGQTYQSWPQAPVNAQRPIPPPHASSFPFASPTSPIDHQRPVQQFQHHQVPPQPTSLGPAGTPNAPQHNNDGQARGPLISQNPVQGNLPQPTLQQPPTPSSNQHAPDPLLQVKKQAADHTGHILAPAREALENAWGSVFSCVSADFARIKVVNDSFQQQLAESEKERNRLSAELAKVNKDIASATNSFSTLYVNAQRWREEVSKKEAEIAEKTAECRKLNEKIIALETCQRELSAKLLLMEKAGLPHDKIEQLKIALQLELTKLYAPTYSELQHKRQENVALHLRVKALEGELAKLKIAEENTNVDSTQPAAGKPREVIDVDALDEELQKLTKATEMGSKLFAGLIDAGKKEQRPSETPVASSSKMTLDSMGKNQPEVSATKEAVEKRTPTPATIGTPNQPGSEISSRDGERPLKRPRTSTDENAQGLESPVISPAIGNESRRTDSRPPESPVNQSSTKPKFIPSSPTVVEQEQNDDNVIVKPEPNDSFFDKPEEVPPAPDETTSPTERPRRLTMIHLGLVYSQNSKGYTCRLCSLARKAGYRGPVAAYPLNASGEILFSHCEIEHPEACEQIKALSTADVMEKLARLSSVP